MKPVKSSHLEAIHYEPSTKTLTVHFKSGAVYHYPEISQALYNDFEKSSSHGEFLHKHIIPKKK